MATQTITYGTMTLPFARLQVSQETVYSDNGIDHIGTAFTFTVSGWLTADNVTDFGALISQTQCQLNTPRQGFTVQWNDGASNQTLYSFDNRGDDILWGPKPSSVNIGPFLGGTAAMYSWQLRVVTKECFGGGCSLQERPSDVLTITRRFDHKVDQNGQTTRTVSGVLVVAADSVQAGRGADCFRFLVTPNLPSWYKRVNETYTQSEDGTRLSYSITDQEVMWTLPQPITSGRASWTQRLSFDGMRMDYILSGEFSSTVNTTKKQIIDQILQLAADRFPLDGSVALIPVQREFTEEIYESNTVRFTMSAWSACGAGNDPLDIFAGIPQFGKQPTNSSGDSQIIGVYGGDGKGITSGVIADAITVYDACSVTSRSSQSIQAPTGDGSGTTGGDGDQNGDSGSKGNTTGPTGDDPQGTNTGASDAHLAAPYAEVHEEISWEVNNGWKVFYPKQVGAKPIKQQIHSPRVMVFQVGYLSRDADATRPELKPVPPSPIYAEDSCAYLTTSTRTETPNPLGTGGFVRYTVHYSYAMELMLSPVTNNVPAKMDDLQVQYPTDPRRTDGQDLNTRTLSNLPATFDAPS